MLLKDFLPSSHLRDYVSVIGIVHFVFSDSNELPIKTFSPRPGNTLCFFPADPEHVAYSGTPGKIKRPSVCLIGQHTLLTKRYVGREFLAVIIHFQPGALYCLTGIPSNEFTNTHLDAEAVFTGEIKYVNERLSNTTSYKEMIAVVESYLSKLIRGSKRDAHRIDGAAKLLLQATEHISMNWLAKETCLCAKQFERKFLERTGINASLFARIARFDKAFKMKNAQPENDWLSIAVKCGFYDYQHLVRDYKAFTGLTPAAFFQLDSQSPERAFGLQETGIIEL